MQFTWKKYNVLQCVAVCCSVLQCVAVCCSVLQCVAVCCSVLQCAAVCYSVLQCFAVCWSVLQCVAECCSKVSSLYNLPGKKKMTSLLTFENPYLSLSKVGLLRNFIVNWVAGWFFQIYSFFHNFYLLFQHVSEEESIVFLKFLKSQLATQFTIENGYSADFWECLSFAAGTRGQASTLFLKISKVSFKITAVLTFEKFYLFQQASEGKRKLCCRKSSKVSSLCSLLCAFYSKMHIVKCTASWLLSKWLQYWLLTISVFCSGYPNEISKARQNYYRTDFWEVFPKSPPSLSHTQR